MLTKFFNVMLTAVLSMISVPQINQLCGPLVDSRRKESVRPPDRKDEMTHYMRIVATLILVVLWAPMSYSQTQVDIRSQGRNFDLSGANSTKPLKTGTALPAQCTTGEMFFKVDAPAGQNVYGCTATNTWTAEVSVGGTGGGSTAASTAMTVTAAGGNLSVGNCTPAAPCNVGVGSKTYQYTTIGSTTSIAAATPCTLYVFVDTANGNRTVGRDTACVTSIALVNLVDAPGVKTFPPTAIPLGTCTVVSNAVSSCTALQPAFSRELLKNGPNITLTPNAADGSITIDSTAGAATPVFSSSGLGYYIPFLGADGTGTEIGVSVANQVKYWQVVVPSQMIIRKIAGRQGTGGTGGHFSFAIYDTTKSKVAQFSTVSNNAGGVFTATCTQVTIGPGVYYIGFSSDNTALRLYGIANSSDYELILASQPATEQRFFTGTNLASGTSTMSLPSTFATDTVTGLQEPLPKLVLLP
jgi:hypothetical protein